MHLPAWLIVAIFSLE